MPIREAQRSNTSKNTERITTGLVKKMMEQVARVAIPIFNYVFPDCEGFFAFDNASNHCAFTPDALVVAAKMNLMSGGKQPLLRNGWDYSSNRPQSMVFGDDHPDVKLRGKAKGIRQVLLERGLWRERSADGFKFRLIFPKTHDRPGCDPNSKS